jgi:hypothetical protein
MYAVDKMEKTQNSMMEDVTRHEVCCCELAVKFDQQNDVMKQLIENIEHLKTYSIVNDLHTEAFLPLQIANIAFEVGKGIVTKTRAPKYERHFVNRVVRKLEKNLLQVCDPQVDRYTS